MNTEARFLILAARDGNERLLQKSGLPLPEPERLDALVEIATSCRLELAMGDRATWVAELFNHIIGTGPTPWAALTEALLAATHEPL